MPAEQSDQELAMLIFNQALTEATWWNFDDVGNVVEFGVRDIYMFCAFNRGTFHIFEKPTGINHFIGDTATGRGALEHTRADVERALQHIKPNKPVEDDDDDTIS